MVKNNKGKANYSKAWAGLALTRLLLGFVFLWAFFDKTFGLGLSTVNGKAWIDGVSPTTGFLTRGVNPDGPIVDFFTSLAGNVVIDWVFMVGLLGIGLALVLGIALRLTAFSATIMLGLMWLALIPLKNNPVVDDHIIYIVIIWVIALAPRKFSLVNYWLNNKIVKNNSWLW